MTEMYLYPIDKEDFKICQHNIVALTRKLLTMEGGVERQVIGKKWWRKNKKVPKPADFKFDKPASIGRMNLVKIEYAAYSHVSDAHTILFVKNEYLQNGWSLFDADGVDGLLALFPNKGVLKLDINRPVGSIDSASKVKIKHTQITPNVSINTNQGYKEDLEAEREKGDDGDRYNLGFCGLFLFMFLCFYSRNKNNPNWPAYWDSYLCKLKHSVWMTYCDEYKNIRGRQKALMATCIAQEIYRIIQNDYSHITRSRIPSERDVNELIKKVNHILVHYLT